MHLGGKQFWEGPFLFQHDYALVHKENSMPRPPWLSPGGGWNMLGAWLGWIELRLLLPAKHSGQLRCTPARLSLSFRVLWAWMTFSPACILTSQRYSIHWTLLAWVGPLSYYFWFWKKYDLWFSDNIAQLGHSFRGGSVGVSNIKQ